MAIREAGREDYEAPEGSVTRGGRSSFDYFGKFAEYGEQFDMFKKVFGEMLPEEDAEGIDWEELWGSFMGTSEQPYRDPFNPSWYGSIW